MKPFGRKLLSVKIHSPKIGSGIVATAHDGTRTLVCPIEISHTSQIAVATVAIVYLIAPSRRIGRVTLLQSLALSHLRSYTERTVWIIPYSMNRLAGKSVEYRQHLWPSHDSTYIVAIIGAIVYLFYVCICSSPTHEFSFSIHRTSRCLADHLRLAIAIEIVNQELGIVSTSTDILSQVDAPELLAIEFVTIEDDISRIAIMRIVM